MTLLAHILESTLQLPTFQAPDLAEVLLRLAAILPLVGGYLLAREGKGNLLLEVLAVLLLTLATVVPFNVTPGVTLSSILAALFSRWPVMVFLLGLAFVRDGGPKIVLGVVLMAVSGLILIPHA